MRWNLLIRPSWLALTLVVWVFAGACFTLLAPWQFSRDAQREAQNSALTAAMQIDPVPLDSMSALPNSDIEWRRVNLTGRYLVDDQAVARLRTVQGEAAYEVLTPFQLNSGSIVLVNRGYVRPIADVAAPPLSSPPVDQVTITTWARVDEPDTRDAINDNGQRQVYSINSMVVGRATGLNLRPGYFQLLDAQPGVENALPLPILDAGPFFSYALQWIAFGTFALGGWVYFSWRELKPGGTLNREKRLSVSDILAQDLHPSVR